MRIENIQARLVRIQTEQVYEDGKAVEEVLVARFDIGDDHGLSIPITFKQAEELGAHFWRPATITVLISEPSAPEVRWHNTEPGPRE